MNNPGKEDGDIFFGRDAEAGELRSRVFQSRLLLVYGSSGTGKTNLIQCGLGSQFDEADWFPGVHATNMLYLSLEHLKEQIEKVAI